MAGATAARYLAAAAAAGALAVLGNSALKPSAWVGGLALRGSGSRDPEILALRPGRWLQRSRTTLGAVGAPTKDAQDVFMQGIGLMQRADMTNGVRLINQAAEMGHADAQTCMGQFAIEGAMGVPRNPQVAMEWFQRAADGGNRDGIENLAIMLHNGDGVPENKREAAKLYRRAADLGSEQAMAQLAMMLIRGDGVPKDMQLGAQWLVKCAQKGDYLEELTDKLATGNLDPETKIKLAEMMEKLRDVQRDNPAFNKQTNPKRDDDTPASGW